MYKKNNDASKSQSSPAIQVLISCLPTGQVQVSGFPNNLFNALDILRAAELAVLSHFHKLAKTGKLDEDLSFVQPAIIMPDEELVDAQGNALKQ